MSYIGNSPVYQAFITDSFSGNGSTVAFTMSVAPANTASVLVAISGVLQDPSTYSVVGTVLTFSAAPPAGTGNISVRYLGVPASNIATTAYRTLTEFTATSGQTTFVTSSYVPGFLNVYQNGVMLGSADYTATDGTSVVLAVGATAGDLITTEGFYVSSVANAIQAIPGSVTSTYLAADSVGSVQIAAGAVGSSELAAGAVESSKIATGAVGTTQLAAGAVGPANLTGAQTGSAPIYGCRAWVNFDGAAASPTIAASGNVTSITDNGVGDYTVNFTTAMPDANYAVNASTISGTRAMVITTNSLTSGSVRVQINYVNFGGGNIPAIDVACSVVIFR